MVNKLILLLALISSSFCIELDFKKTTLDEFELQGFSSNVIYKNKVDRDIQIARIWDKFLNNKSFKLEKSKNKKIYVIYTNYKANSFDCFIGLKVKEHILDTELRIVPESKYQKSVLKYEKSMNMSTIWDDIQKQNIQRDFKIDIEEYDLLDLQKEKYFISIYLSTK